MTVCIVLIHIRCGQEWGVCGLVIRSGSCSMVLARMAYMAFVRRVRRFRKTPGENKQAVRRADNRARYRIGEIF